MSNMSASRMEYWLNLISTAATNVLTVGGTVLKSAATALGTLPVMEFFSDGSAMDVKLTQMAITSAHENKVLTFLAASMTSEQTVRAPGASGKIAVVIEATISWGVLTTNEVVLRFRDGSGGTIIGSVKCLKAGGNATLRWLKGSDNTAIVASTDVLSGGGDIVVSLTTTTNDL